VGVNVGVPSKFDLSQNYLNLFNPSTPIKLGTVESVLIQIIFYDLLREKVK